MTFVTTTCATCGEVEVPLDRVVLRVCESEGVAECVVRCPSCGDRLVKQANEAMTSLMMCLGVEVSRWDALVVESTRSDLGAITPDELVAFRARLDADEALVRHLQISPF